MPLGIISENLETHVISSLLSMIRACGTWVFSFLFLLPCPDYTIMDYNLLQPQLLFELLFNYCDETAWQKQVTEENVLGFRVLESVKIMVGITEAGRRTWWWDSSWKVTTPSCNHVSGRCNPKTESFLGMMWTLEASKPVPSNTLPSTRPHVLTLLKHFHELVTETSTFYSGAMGSGHSTIQEN